MPLLLALLLIPLFVVVLIPGAHPQIGAAAVSGIAMSMAAGAVVLGYYLIYWIAVRRHLRSTRRTVVAPHN